MQEYLRTPGLGLRLMNLPVIVQSYRTPSHETAHPERSGAESKDWFPSTLSCYPISSTQYRRWRSGTASSPHRYP